MDTIFSVRCILTTTLCFIFFCCSMAAIPKQSILESAYEDCLSGLNGVFSGVVLIAQGEEILFHQAYGYDPAHKNDSSPISVNRTFFVGEFTQALIAAIFLRLQDKEILCIHDAIKHLLPDSPRGEKVTIHHLLAHRSGIPDYSLAVQEKMQNRSSPRQRSFGLRGLCHLDAKKSIDTCMGLRPVFLPGYMYDRSSSNYVILGHLIECATEKSLDVIAQELIWNTLDIPGNETFFYSALQQQSSLLQAYQRDATPVGLDTHPVGYTCAIGDGNLCLSAYAAYALTKASLAIESPQHGDALLSQEARKILRTPFSANWSYAWTISPRQNRPAIWATGQSAGYWFDICYYPDTDLYTVVLSNHLASLPLAHRLKYELSIDQEGPTSDIEIQGLHSLGNTLTNICHTHMSQ